jgi:predicted phage tail protein
MPQIFIAAVAYVIGEGVAATVIGTLLFTAASYLISDALKPSSQESDLSNSTYSDRGQLINTESTSEPVCLPYGRCRVGVNRVLGIFPVSIMNIFMS